MCVWGGGGGPHEYTTLKGAAFHTSHLTPHTPHLTPTHHTSHITYQTWPLFWGSPYPPSCLRPGPESGRPRGPSPLTRTPHGTHMPHGALLCPPLPALPHCRATLGRGCSGSGICPQTQVLPERRGPPTRGPAHRWLGGGGWGAVTKAWIYEDRGLHRGTACWACPQHACARTTPMVPPQHHVCTYHARTMHACMYLPLPPAFAPATPTCMYAPVTPTCICTCHSHLHVCTCHSHLHLHLPLPPACMHLPLPPAFAPATPTCIHLHLPPPPACVSPRCAPSAGGGSD